MYTTIIYLVYHSPTLFSLFLGVYRASLSPIINRLSLGLFTRVASLLYICSSLSCAGYRNFQYLSINCSQAIRKHANIYTVLGGVLLILRLAPELDIFEIILDVIVFNNIFCALRLTRLCMSKCRHDGRTRQYWVAVSAPEKLLLNFSLEEYLKAFLHVFARALHTDLVRPAACQSFNGVCDVLSLCGTLSYLVLSRSSRLSPSVNRRYNALYNIGMRTMVCAQTTLVRIEIWKIQR